MPTCSPREERNQEHVIKAKLFGSVGDKPVLLLLLILNIFFTALGILVRSYDSTGSCKLNATNPQAKNTGTSESVLLAIFGLPIVAFIVIMLLVMVFQSVYMNYYERILFILHTKLDTKKIYCYIILALTGLFLPIMVPYFTWICCTSLHSGTFRRGTDKKYKRCDIVSNLFKLSITLLAGILYLAGDNLLLLNEYTVGALPLGELRPSIVSGALLLYIIKDHGFKFFAELNEILNTETIKSEMSDESDDIQVTDLVSEPSSKALSSRSAWILIQVKVIMQWFGLAALMVPLDAVFTSIIDNHFQGIDSTGLCEHESSILVNITAAECIIATKTVIYFIYISGIWILLIICYLIYTVKRVLSVRLIKKAHCSLYVSLLLLAVSLALLIPIFIAGDNNFPWINYALQKILNDSYSICRLADARLALLGISLVAVVIFLNGFVCLMTWKLALMGHQYVKDIENIELL